MVHDKLLLQELLYFVDVLDLVELHGHHVLLIVATFDQTFRANECEQDLLLGILVRNRTELYL